MSFLSLLLFGRCIVLNGMAWIVFGKCQRSFSWLEGLTDAVLLYSLDKYLLLFRRVIFYSFAWLANSEWDEEKINAYTECLLEGPLQ